MFGEKVDYIILRALAHDRSIATEEELDGRAERYAPLAAGEEVAKLQEHTARFDRMFPIDPGLRYLDMGCGTGELTIGLAMLGCTNVDGIDVVPRNIAAGECNARRLGVDGSVRFICADLNDWTPSQKYDVLLSFDALEHIADPKHFLERMADFVTPDGVAVVGFGPLFHSPFGDHMSAFFRAQIPWRGILFSEKAMLKIRRECYRPGDAAEHYQDIVGGLNLMRYSEFLAHVRDAGWEFTYLALNPRLKHQPVLRHVSAAVTRIPGLRDYFVFSVYAIMRRSPTAPS